MEALKEQGAALRATRAPARRAASSSPRSRCRWSSSSPPGCSCGRSARSPRCISGSIAIACCSSASTRSAREVAPADRARTLRADPRGARCRARRRCAAAVARHAGQRQHLEQPRSTVSGGVDAARDASAVELQRDHARAGSTTFGTPIIAGRDITEQRSQRRAAGHPGQPGVREAVLQRRQRARTHGDDRRRRRRAGAARDRRRRRRRGLSLAARARCRRRCTCRWRSSTTASGRRRRRCRSACGRRPDRRRCWRAASARAITGVNRDLALTFRPLADQVDASLTQERVVAMLAGFFGALALLLAALGLYGVTSYAVSRRRTEIGIRMALGAAPGGVVRLVLSRVTLLVGIGVLVGGGISVWASKFVATLLYGLEPRDPADAGRCRRRAGDGRRRRRLATRVSRVTHRSGRGAERQLNPTHLDLLHILDVRYVACLGLPTTRPIFSRGRSIS